jgi:hypothetical protein
MFDRLARLANCVIVFKHQNVWRRNQDLRRRPLQHPPRCWQVLACDQPGDVGQTAIPPILPNVPSVSRSAPDSAPKPGLRSWGSIRKLKDPAPFGAGGPSRRDGGWGPHRPVSCRRALAFHAIIIPPASTAPAGSMARPVARAKNRQQAGFVVTETCDDPDFRVTETRDDPDKTRPGTERSNPSPPIPSERGRRCRLSRRMRGRAGRKELI